MYRKYIKRPLDFFLSLCAIIVFSPFLLIFIIIGAFAMKGNPFFTQLRPGMNENIFRLIKFRTMTCEKDKNGEPLPDELRMTKYGRFLRATSIDELPELLNILKGDMAVIGPRPLLVRDMVFMTEEQRKRHTVRPGLSGLAQVNGRNAIKWEIKLSYDLEYIEDITFFGDVKLIFITVFHVFKRKDITEDGKETAQDLGDYLLHYGFVDEKEYESGQNQAKELMNV